jgi:hypothetical protein
MRAVAKKRVRKRQARADRAPKTIGDLRKLLARLGNPWQPDPRLSDAEPIPQFPTGGDGTMDPVGQVLPKGGALDAIRKDPPSNPHLRDLWIERGLIRRSDKRQKRATKKIRRPVGRG